MKEKAWSTAKINRAGSITGFWGQNGNVASIYHWGDFEFGWAVWDKDGALIAKGEKGSRELAKRAALEFLGPEKY